MDKRKSVGILSVLKLVSTLLGIIYSIAQVRIFGTDKSIELFFAASSLLYLIVSVTQTGQLSEIFLPQYLQIKENHGIEIAHKSYSVVINRIGLGSIIIIIIAGLFHNLLVNLMVPGYTSNEKNQVGILFLSYLPLIVLTISNGFMTTVLNAEKAYGKSELSAIFNSFFSLIILILFAKSLGIWSLVISLYIGQLFELGTSIYFLKNNKIKYSLVWKIKEFDHKLFFRNIYSTLLYVLTTQLFNVVLTASISYLPQGVFAIYRYTINIFEKAASLILQPFSTIFYTSIAELKSKNLKDESRNLLDFSIKANLVIGLFVFVIILVSGYNLLGFLWHSKKFDANSLQTAYYFLITWFVLILFQGTSQLYRKVAIMTGLVKRNYFYLSIGMLISSATTYLLVTAFGTYGLVASIFISRILYLIVPMFSVYFYQKQYFVFPKFNFILNITVVSVLAVATSYFINWGVFKFLPFNQLNYTFKVFTNTFITIFVLYLYCSLFRVGFVLDQLTHIRVKIYNKFSTLLTH